MKLEDQVVSLELAKELEALGVKQESAFYWYFDVVDGDPVIPERYFLHDNKDGGFNFVCSAFTVGEIGEMLPVGYHSGKSGVGKPWICKSRRKSEVFEVSDTEADARAKMLINLIKTGVVTT